MTAEALAPWFTVCALVPVMVPLVPSTKVTVYVSLAKLAVRVRSAVTLVTVSGLAVEVVNPEPVQLTKW